MTGNLILIDRAKCPSSSAGLSNFSLGAAVTGMQNFGGIGNGNYTYYTAWDGGANWEVGIAAYVASGTSLTRVAGQVLDGSAGAGVLVNFPTAPMVWGDCPAYLLSGVIIAKTANYTVKPWDKIVEFDCTSGNLTCTVPLTIGAAAKSSVVRIVKTDATNNLLVINDGTNDVSALATPANSADMAWRDVYSNGTNLRALGVG